MKNSYWNPFPILNSPVGSCCNFRITYLYHQSHLKSVKYEKIIYEGVKKLFLWMAIIFNLRDIDTSG